MAGGYTHPQRGPLTEQWDCITVASKKSDPFDYLRSPLLKLFFINGLQEEDQWVVLLITFPYLPSLRFTVNYFVLPDGHCCVASYKIFKTWPSSAKYFTLAQNTIDNNGTNQCLSQKCHLLFRICVRFVLAELLWAKYSHWVQWEVSTKSTRWIALYLCELQWQQSFLACLLTQGFDIKSVFDENCVTHLARVLKAKSRKTLWQSWLETAMIPLCCLIRLLSPLERCFSEVFG